MPHNPSKFRGADRPVEQVNWEEAREFARKLTEFHHRSGLISVGWRWDLPTEAQWVQAATRLPGFQWGRHVWEWTATDFLPLPGFAPGPYRDYSEPWFGDHKVLRGGCHATRATLIRNTWRNFYKPGRNDVYAGFRTCAL